MNGYRDSHIATGRGRDYDVKYGAGAEAFYWGTFERPLLSRLFAEVGEAASGRYLDVACGTGRITGVGYRHFRETVGIDVSGDMLVVARQKLPQVTFLTADVGMEPPDIGRFQVVTLFRFLLNAEPALRHAVLAWIRSVIADDGILIVNNHLNARSPLGLALGLRNRQLGYTRHNLLTDEDVAALLAVHGFKISASYGFGFVPAFRNRLWLPRGVLYGLERALGRFGWLARRSKDRIYVCHPV